MKRDGSRRRPLAVIIVTVALLAGFALFLYPSVSEYISSLNFRREIEDYRRDVGHMSDDSRREMLEAARAWNEELLSVSSGRVGALTEAQRERYGKLLDPTGTGMMGYVEIEELGIYLPVYHGTREETLHSGIGHVEGSSLPVGGAGTHAILSGHTGLPSAKLFSNIDRLEKGDIFIIHISGEALTYKVDSVRVMLPEEAEKQEIAAGEDICTLMTCTPYGVNTHRLLVRGTRTANPPAVDDAGTEGEIGIPVNVPLPLRIFTVAAVVCAVGGVVTVVVRRVRRNRKNVTKGDG